jgi:ectoine hydroxylase-related dioxygenase (phytanoyl-CoA dioxygenase family)
VNGRPESYPLTAEQIEEVRERGHAVLRGVLSREEMAACRSFLRRYILAKEEILVGISSAAAAAEFNLGDAPQEVADFVTSPRLGEIAARLLVAEAVRILHFAGLFKPAGGAPTPWHQDLAYLPLDGEKMITLWIPLDDFTPDMGTLVFAEGSHRQGRTLGRSALEEFPLAHNGPMQAGDLSLHLGWTLHSAQENSTDREREALAIVYYADGTRIRVRGNLPVMQRLLNRYFAGLANGDPAIGPMNPVVFRREPVQPEQGGSRP